MQYYWYNSSDLRYIVVLMLIQKHEICCFDLTSDTISCGEKCQHSPTMCRLCAEITFKLRVDMIPNWCPSRAPSRGCVTSAQPQKKSFPQLVRKHAHPLCSLPTSNTWIFIFQRRGGWGLGGGKREEVVVEGWRSLVTLYVPVCARLHLRLSSHLTGLSVSTADQNASLSLTGWTDSAAIQTDSSSGSWWREGRRWGGIWGREERQKPVE